MVNLLEEESTILTPNNQCRIDNHDMQVYDHNNLQFSKPNPLQEKLHKTYIMRCHLCKNCYSLVSQLENHLVLEHEYSLLKCTKCPFRLVKFHTLSLLLFLDNNFKIETDLCNLEKYYFGAVIIFGYNIFLSQEKV